MEVFARQRALRRSASTQPTGVGSVEGQEPSSADPVAPSTVDRFLAWMLLIAVALGSPLSLYAANHYLGVALPKLALHAAVVFGLGAWLMIVCRRLGLSWVGASISSSLVVMMLINWNSVQDRTRGFGVVILLIGILLVVRLQWSGLLRGVVVVAVAMIGVAPLIEVILAVSNTGELHGYEHDRTTVAASGQVEDVVIVVMDQWAGIPFLERYGHDPQDFVEELRGHRMTVPNAGWSTAATTYVSLPDMLQMAPFLPDGVRASPDDYGLSYKTMGGDNRFVEGLRSAGFTYTHIEGGWEGTECGDPVDRCIEAPWIDSTAWNLWRLSVVGNWLEQTFRHPYTAGALSAAEELTEMLPEVQENGRRDLVFAHVLLPHGPFLVEPDCGFREGATTASSSNAEGYIAQVRCAESITTELAGLADPSTALFITGDHGNPTLRAPDEPADWSDEEIAERLSVMMAYRLPEGCKGPEEPVTSVIMATIFTCAMTSEPSFEEPFFTVIRNDVAGVQPHHAYRVPDSRMDSIRSQFSGQQREFQSG